MNDYRVEMVWSHYHAGRHREAIEVLKGLLGDDPENALYHGLLASCLVRTGRVYAGEHELMIALRLMPELPMLFWIKAEIDIFNNRIPQALESCDQALMLDPTSYGVLLLKHRAYMHIGKRQLALTCIEQAANVAPDAPDIPLAFAEYYYGIGKSDEALPYCLEALENNAADESANILMGKIKLKQGDISDAEYHARFVIMNNPNSQAALHLLGNIKVRKNPFFGLWWWFNSRLAHMGTFQSAIVLISGFLLFNLLSQIIQDLGYPVAANVVSFAWLGLVLYSWLGVPAYTRTLRKEMERFSFNKDF